MGDLIHRNIQHDLLRALSDVYPDKLVSEQLVHLAPGNALRVNVAYLHAHGLVEAKFFNDLSDGPVLGWASITAKGLDFLADDGGLGAILAVQTIRLHQDTVRELLIARVEESNADETVKGKLINQLKALPAQGVERLAEQAFDQALRTP